MTTATPTVLWAQRSSSTDAEKNLIYLTIELLDPKDLKIDLKPEYLELNATSNETPYHLKIEFYAKVNPDLSKINTTNGSHIFIILRKEELNEEYWPRLTSEKIKLHNIKTDFNKWVDEDEQDEAKDDNLDGPGNMDFSQMMGGMGGPGGPGGPGGMGGMGGMDFASMMGGAGGAGGPGGFDLASMMKNMNPDDLKAAAGGQEDENPAEGEEEEEIEEIKKD
ncbi:unnamed protein product [Candida verbasci]|uniref:CS domain-containing protein n=1 Tax=Candida verbasci TaxID=1227364 RepID=A0A9W4XIZ2_9ASCO|nr:unnamed protein product [Candida verbasci]